MQNYNLENAICLIGETTREKDYLGEVIVKEIEQYCEFRQKPTASNPTAEIFIRCTIVERKDRKIVYAVDEQEFIVRYKVEDIVFYPGNTHLACTVVFLKETNLTDDQEVLTDKFEYIIEQEIKAELLKSLQAQHDKVLYNKLGTTQN